MVGRVRAVGRVSMMSARGRKAIVCSGGADDCAGQPVIGVLEGGPVDADPGGAHPELGQMGEHCLRAGVSPVDGDRSSGTPYPAHALAALQATQRGLVADGGEGGVLYVGASGARSLGGGWYY